MDLSNRICKGVCQLAKGSCQNLCSSSVEHVKEWWTEERLKAAKNGVAYPYIEGVDHPGMEDIISRYNGVIAEQTPEATKDKKPVNIIDPNIDKVAETPSRINSERDHLTRRTR
jgi:hypothetical protein